MAVVDEAPIALASDRLREIKAPETFRVWHDNSDPDHVGEYVITVTPEGIRIWPSHLWEPSALESRPRDADDPGAHPGYLTEWWELELISGHATEIVDDRRSDIREIVHELESWTSIRSRESHRIARARELQRTERIRAIVADAGRVLGAWMPPGRRRVTWRDMVRRRRDGTAADPT